MAFWCPLILLKPYDSSVLTSRRMPKTKCFVFISKHEQVQILLPSSLAFVPPTAHCVHARSSSLCILKKKCQVFVCNSQVLSSPARAEVAAKRKYLCNSSVHRVVHNVAEQEATDKTPLDFHRHFLCLGQKYVISWAHKMCCHILLQFFAMNYGATSKLCLLHITLALERQSAALSTRKYCVFSSNCSFCIHFFCTKEG